MRCISLTAPLAHAGASTRTADAPNALPRAGALGHNQRRTACREGIRLLYQYHGNDMEALRAAACTLLGAAPPPPLVAERLVVPNVGMAKWLRAGIARHSGIAANLRAESPALFLDGLARAVLDEAPERDGAPAWGKEQLALRVMRELPALRGRSSWAVTAKPDAEKITFT